MVFCIADVSSRTFTVTNISGSLTCAVASSFVCTFPLAVITVTRVVVTRTVFHCAEFKSFLLNMCNNRFRKRTTNRHSTARIIQGKPRLTAKSTPPSASPHRVRWRNPQSNWVPPYHPLKSTSKKKSLRTNASHTATSVPPTTCFVHTYEESHHLLLTPSQTVDSTTSTI